MTPEPSTSIDRTTRLAVTLTIFGALFLVLKSSIGIWYSIFTNIAYTNDFLNYDYMLSIAFVSTALVVSVSIIRYVFFELQTYKHFEDAAEKTKTVSRADWAFERIFKDIKMLSMLLLALLLIFLIREMILRESILPILIGLILGIVLFFVGYFAYKKSTRVRQFMDNSTVGRASSASFSLFSTVVYIVLIVFVFGLAFTISSLASTNQQAKVELEDTKEVPLNIELQNYLSPLVTVTFTNYAVADDRRSFTLEAKEKLELYSEAVIFEKVQEGEKFDSLIQNIDDEIDSFNINKKKSLAKYELNLGEYIEEGRYLVEVVILSREDSVSNVTKFMTTVEKSGDKVAISEKRFEAK